jgi:hypothetical protein
MQYANITNSFTLFILFFNLDTSKKPALYVRTGTVLGLIGGDTAGSLAGMGDFGFFGLPLRASGRYPGTLRASSQARRFML